MSSSNKKRKHVSDIDLVAIREANAQAFRKEVKCIQCPTCHVEFTDFAVDWADAWSEGRTDLLFEQGILDGERDGPYKLKCELCGHKSWLSPFNSTVTSAEDIHAE